MTCARCGAQNPDGNLYCMSCGTPLTAPSAVATAPMQGAPSAPPPGPLPGPPPGPPPGIAPPTGYQSPYYTPAGPVPPLHRTPWMLIIAGVVALVVLMAGCGTALAISIVLGIAAGALSATRPYSWFDYLASLGAMLGVSVPSFFQALLFIYLFDWSST